MSIIVDDFNRALLGPNWFTPIPAPMIIDSQNLGAIQGGTGKNVHLCECIVSPFNVVLPPSDQFSEVKVSDLFLNDCNIQVFVRRNHTTGQRYGFFWYGNEWSIKLDGGLAAPYLAKVPGNSPIPDDLIRIEAVESEIKGYLNGTLMLSVYDTTLKNGRPGIVVGTRDVVNFPTIAVASWCGGAL